MRLNVGISPSDLTDEHLFAESRELKMLPSYFKKYGYKSIGKVPSEFTLGKGHILFFAYKPCYTLKRYKLILKECFNRNISIKDESYRWDIYGTLTDNFEDEPWMKNILIKRICEKIDSSPKKEFHYYHKNISKEYAKKLLKQ